VGLQPRSTISWLVQTVPIYHGYAQRALWRIPLLQMADALVKDWPSQTSRLRLGQSPPPSSLSRDCCAWADPVPLCSAVDWHSLDRHKDIRVNLADHAENTTCPLLAAPKIYSKGITPLTDEIRFACTSR